MQKKVINYRCLETILDQSLLKKHLNITSTQGGFKNVKDTCCICKRKSTGQSSVTNEVVENSCATYLRFHRTSTHCASRELVWHVDLQTQMEVDVFAETCVY
ncbi:hypothetical protein PR048_020768 [Dryococelus australis]|uniref:Uncharacterized protein n=1 Tax=Dryococelus australis TaxID=614101 RepID=A0ABQ9GWF2_9NEOP|nr:hypothetical protein PR048_020768 [Dryococelus australis]